MNKTMNMLRLLSIIAISILMSCKKDKPKMLPAISTTPPMEITTNSAKGGGTITNEGNDVITERGLVYSNVVNTPTLADSKLVATSAEKNFEVVMSGLSSGSTYYVRAYATNSVGTTYGDVLSFMTGNAAPVASNVTVTGTPAVNVTLTATYAYTDAENNPQSGTIFQWYMANDASGAGAMPILDAKQATFTVMDAQQGKYIAVGVTPKSSAGTSTGIEVKSVFVGAVGEATTVTFDYNGKSVTYAILTSAKTQRKWLDRNLGAPNVASAFNDFANYGDLFQWGRLPDGHQLTTRASTDAATSGANSTSTLSPSDVPSSSSFISNPAGSNWRTTPNDNLWQGVSGINNPCPKGWRIPTKDEWIAEAITDANDGYSKLKLTLGGIRSFYDGKFNGTETGGYYWTSSFNAASAISLDYEIRVFFTMDNIIERASGLSCRCIKN